MIDLSSQWRRHLFIAAISFSGEQVEQSALVSVSEWHERPLLPLNILNNWTG